MRDGPPVGEVLDIAASTEPLLERARGIVETLDRWLRVDAVWLRLSDPQSKVFATVGSGGLEQSVLDRLDLPTVADPDSRASLGIPLSEPGLGHLGMLSLLFERAEPPSPAVRAELSGLAPVIARGVSPVRSLLATARLVRGATAGAVLLRDGTCLGLPGFEEHHLLLADSAVVAIARKSLLRGQVYRSFLWPTDETPGSAPTTHHTHHTHLTVLAATDAPSFVLGTVLASPDAQCRGLTPRELEVLGLLVAGRSNQQVANRLRITSRTVATHVEHILHKLDVPTRTQAAVLAERDGCYVPATRRSHAPG